MGTKEQDKFRITATEMKLLRNTAKYTLFDQRRNQDTIKELNIHPVLGRSTIKNTNGYKTFAMWTDIDSRTLL
jgi:hypothetical protein